MRVTGRAAAGRPDAQRAAQGGAPSVAANVSECDHYNNFHSGTGLSIKYMGRRFIFII
jgi:hypothetical protein